MCSNHFHEEFHARVHDINKKEEISRGEKEKIYTKWKVFRNIKVNIHRLDHTVLR